VALMTLYERGHFQLNDPVHRFIPEFRDLKVTETAEDGSTRLVDPHQPMTVRHLLTHMSGLGYDFGAGTPGGGGVGVIERGPTLESMVAGMAKRPLHSHPGTEWRYSVSIDVCARVVEILSGRNFDEYLRDEVLGPLGMTDTGFSVPDAKIDRFAASYRRNRNKELRLADDPQESNYRRPPTLFLGGGGLVSTTPDYLRFTQMLLNGGELEGVRILGRKTVELMASNHLPGGGDMRQFAAPGGYGETGFDGLGFGLTMAVSQGPVPSQAQGSPGDYSWGGLASTIFWIDPVEDLLVIFMTQLIPSGTFNFRNQLKALVYPAIVD
jgi:CubicO group peptidase (beta-lactamase class C family)